MSDIYSPKSIDNEKKSIIKHRSNVPIEKRQNDRCILTVRENVGIPKDLEQYVTPEKKTGRPRQKFDLELIYSLALLQCTNVELAGILRIDEKTVAHRFGPLIALARDHGRKALRRKMYDVAMQGHVNMLIWLSKQYLGMKDRSAEEVPNTILNINIANIP